MFILSPNTLNTILRCPLCKTNLERTESTWNCQNCNTSFPDTRINVGTHEETTSDFRIQKRPYCYTESEKIWREEQEHYEERSRTHHNVLPIQGYLNEINGVTEIYTQEFHLQGSVLDVGGHQGRLRHFLDEKTTLYISIDPYRQTFSNIESNTPLLGAYPELQKPCYFIIGVAEHLPFTEQSFDWVHMRSVLDHFKDPYITLKEAYRVLKPGGKILIGLAIMEKLQLKEQKKTLLQRMAMKVQKDGISSLFQTAIQKIIHRISHTHTQHHHVFRFSHAQLKEMLQDTDFTVNHEHWQKPPTDFCLYVDAIKQAD